MAFTVSGIFTDNVGDALANTGDLDLVQASGILVALYNNSIVIDGADDYDVANAGYNAGLWTNTNEVSDANWTSGGIATANTSLTAGSPAAGQLRFDGDNISVSNTTLSDIRGCLVYDSVSTGDLGICGIAFSGAPYSTSNGTLAITWDANGIFYLDLVP